MFAERTFYMHCKSFFSPLAGQPKKMTHYTLAAEQSWYNKL